VCPKPFKHDGGIRPVGGNLGKSFELLPLARFFTMRFPVRVRDGIPDTTRPFSVRTRGGLPFHSGREGLTASERRKPGAHGPDLHAVAGGKTTALLSSCPDARLWPAASGLASVAPEHQVPVWPAPAEALRQ